MVETAFSLVNDYAALPTMNIPRLFCIVLGGLPLFAIFAVQAQTITPANDGTSTQITVDGDRIDIHGGSLSGDGANLFHSFQDFGLSESQIANFLSQPGIETILGRVVGGNPSVINGLLQVTGGSSNLYLMNPSGIIFGSQAQLNVPGDFTATTATGIGFDSGAWFNAIGSPDYTALVGTPNQFAFDGAAAGAIVNAGDLTVNLGQDITLLAGQTANTGTLAAPEGRVTIAAVPGESLVRISQPGHLLSLEVEPPRTPTGELDVITSLDLPALLTASGIDSGLTVTAAGEIHLDATGTILPNAPQMNLVSGTVTAAEVNLLGDRVGLLGAQVNASGKTGGGNVRIGGDYRGEGDVPNATFTYVDSGSMINANGLDSGDGGRVIVWADDTTRFLGEINARGVQDGGFVEVSGKQNLVFPDLTTVDVSGAEGQVGTLLLDPENIEVASTGNPIHAAFLPNIFSTLGSGTFQISFTALDIALSSNNVFLEASNNITFLENYTYGGSLSNATLFLSAGGTISTETINLTAGNNISLVAQAGGNVFTGEVIGAAAVDLFAPQSIETDTIRDVGQINLNADQHLFVDGYLETSGGPIALFSNGTIQVAGVNAAGASIDSNLGGEITINHGGGALGLPFVVGDPSLNGTSGSITTGSSTVAPFREVQGRLTEGNITIDDGIDFEFCEFAFCGAEIFFLEELGFAEEFSEGFELEFEFEFDGEFEGDPEGNPEFREEFEGGPEDNPEFEDDPEPEDEPGFDGDPEWNSEFDEFAEEPGEGIDANSGEAFIEHFGLAAFPELSSAQAQERLQLAAAEAGITPAIVYLTFGTANLNRPESEAISQAKAIASSAAQPKPLGASRALPAPEFVQPHAQQQSNRDDRLEIILISPDAPPVSRTVPGVTRGQIRALARRFQREVSRPTQRNNFLDSAQDLYNALIAPILPELTRLGTEHISFVADAGLRSVPFAALHNGDRFLIEDFSLNLMPSVSLTNLTYTNLQGADVLAMGASTFADQAPLPAVPLELSLISEELRDGEVLLNEAFTLANLRQARRQQAFPIVHLATHGEFRPGQPSNSYIEFWGDRLPLTEIRDLELDNPSVELLVLSACRTALGDQDAELGFAGLAVASGAKTALGSLWYVSDQGTLSLMTAFYEQLGHAPTRAQALRAAQLSLLQGKTRLSAGQLQTDLNAFELDANLANLLPSQDTNFTHPYYWSGFTMIGSPW